MSDVVAALRAGLPAGVVLTGDDVPVRNREDTSRYVPAQVPLALILPRSVEEVSTALAICHAHGQPVTPQGGLTGLAAGATPGADEVAISLERMNGIEEIDRDAGTLTALAGTPLQRIQDAAAEAGFTCGIDLGARGSCTIGGNVATNAGGNQVLRYGMTRRNVLGLEAVLADGTIVRSLNKMLKNNAGYDWTQILVGSEGTLGIVTRVVVMLHPRLQSVETALVALPSPAAAVRLLRAAGDALSGGLLTFEAMFRDLIAVAVKNVGLAEPFAEIHPMLVLMEAPGDAGGQFRETFEAFLARMIEEGTATDALLANSGADRAKFWAYRECMYEFHRLMPPFVGFDVSIPIGSFGEAVETIRRRVLARYPDTILCHFGHMADSNLHVIAMKPGLDVQSKKGIETEVYESIAGYGGSVSAEHGVGRAKRPYLKLSRTAPELQLMRTIKAALDPRGILNPGRIL